MATETPFYPDGRIISSARRCGLARLMLRWPDRREALKTHLQDTPHMAEMCEAYEAACSAVEHWIRSTDRIAASRVAEYRSVIAGLEQDILAMIASHPH
jgi:hypothetical protein